MRYRRLGRTNLQVSELSFGAARGASTQPAEFARTLHAVLGAGINLIDTAPGYDGGQCERALGDVLGGQGDVVLETKYCPYDSYLPSAVYNGSPAALTASVEESLRRMKRGHLDILLGHGLRSVATLDRFMTDGCYDAMVRLQAAGKVRFLGISELSEADGTHEVLRRTVPGGAFDVVMLTLNFLLQTAAKDILPLCQQHDVGTVVMMPLNQASKESGLVSVAAARELVRRHITAGHLPAISPFTDPTLFDFLAPYSVPEAALRYVLAHPVSSCCVGMQSPDRLADNLRAVDPPYLDDARLEHLRQLFGGMRRQVF